MLETADRPSLSPVEVSDLEDELIDRLDDAGWVERNLDPENRRSILVRLTDPGRELVDRAVADHVDDERRILGPLGPDDRTLLDGLLRRLLAGVEDP